MIKIYFDKDIINCYDNCWVPFLYPILGSIKKDKYFWYHYEEQVNEWIKYGKKYLLYEKDIKNCDYIIFPVGFTWDYLPILDKQCKLGKQYNKKVIVFYFSDNEQPIPNNYSNLIVYRVSLNNGNPKNEFAMPGFCEDLGKVYGKDEKVNSLSVGFCGYLGSYNINFIKFKLLLFDNAIIFQIILYSKFLIRYIGKVLENLHFILDSETFIESLIYCLTAKGKGIVYRHNVIKKIKTIGIESKIIERKKMLVPTVNNNLKDEYVVNIKDSLFPLVMRGNGNYSFRLSEVLSLGRIPLFIDTDCRLPFEDLIDYKELFCRCDYKNLGEIENVILKFYKNKDLIKLQRKMREIYESYFSFFGFHKEVVRLLTK